MTEQLQQEYLGDGLYVSFDGWQFCVRAPRENGDHVVYFDLYALKQFNEYVKRITSASVEPRTAAGSLD